MATPATVIASDIASFADFDGVNISDGVGGGPASVDSRFRADDQRNGAVGNLFHPDRRKRRN